MPGASGARRHRCRSRGPSSSAAPRRRWILGRRATCSRGRDPRTRCARTSRRFGAGGSFPGCFATSPSATSERPCSGPRCPRRCSSRRSACRRSSIRRVSWPRRVPRPRRAPRWWPAPRRPTPSRRSPPKAVPDLAGTSSIGRTTTRSPPASSPGRRPPVTRHWSSPSTRSSPAGSRATSSRPGFPSWRGSAMPTSFRIPSSAPSSIARPRRTSGPPRATTWASTSTPP